MLLTRQTPSYSTESYRLLVDLLAYPTTLVVLLLRFDKTFEHSLVLPRGLVLLEYLK